MKKKLLCMAMILLLSAWLTVLTAVNPSSDNYILQAHTLSSGSASSNAPSSANYNLQGSVLGIISGQETNSGNYTILPGFYLGIDTISGELEPPGNVLIWITAGTLYLEWDEVTGAQSYKIYASEDPFSFDWGTPIAIVGSNSWSGPVTESHRFYRIVASTDAPPPVRDGRR